MPTNTPNYNLIKPAENEFYDISQFNQNADIIDTELKLTNDRTLGLQKNVAQGATAPTSPTTNDLWIDTSATPHTLRRWNGTAWEVVGALASDLTTHTALTNTAHGAVSAPTINTLMARDAAGRAQVAAPSVAADIARLDTVTSHTAAQVSNLRTLIRMGAM